MSPQPPATPPYGAHDAYDTVSEAVRGMSETDICARFDLHPHDNGGFISATSTPPLLLLAVGDCLTWQKANMDIEFMFLAGAPLALSWSEDGNHAAAIHLGSALPHHQTAQPIAQQVWHTAESLGAWSLLALHGMSADTLIETAPADWFPTPMAAPLGQA